MTQDTNTGAKKRSALEIIKNYSGPDVRIMEVCGTHTHEIFRLGIRKILPPSIRLISGPGCPVCVTPVSFIDEALILSLDHGCTICTFGDLVGRIFACGCGGVCVETPGRTGGFPLSGF